MNPTRPETGRPSPSPLPSLNSDPHRERFLQGAILVATLSLGYASEAWGLTLLLLFFLGLYPALPAHVRFRPRFVVDLALLIPFSILVSQRPLRGYVGDLQVNVFYYFSFYLCALAILRLYNHLPPPLPPAPGAPPPPSGTYGRNRVATITGCTAVAFALSSLGMGHHAFIGAMAVYTILLFGIFRASHRRHTLTPDGARQLTRTVFITYNFSILAGFALIMVGKNYFPALEDLRHRLWTPSLFEIPGIGFDSEIRLGDVSENRDMEREETIAVRVYGAEEELYLRGRVFHLYSNGQWKADLPLRRVHIEGNRARSPSQPPTRYPLPGFDEPDALEAPDLEIFPAQRYGAHYLLPLNARAFTTIAPEIEVCLDSNVFRTMRGSTAEGYHVFLDHHPAPPLPLEKEERVANLRIPRSRGRSGTHLRYRIDGIVHAQFADLHPQTQLDAILARMRAYFADRYTYRIGITFTPGRDPLEEFLAPDGIRHGHCELFASAGVLLLRRMGIPARYVVGYVAAEEGRLSGAWIAREKHAHAWVEYFHPERGWETLELTPSDGLPPADSNESWGEYLASLWERSERLLENEGVLGFFLLVIMRMGGWMIRFFSSGYTLGVLFAALLVWLVRLRYRMRAAALAERMFPPEVQAQREAFAVWQKSLRGSGLQKRPAETLREYAARIRESEACPDRERLLSFLAAFETVRYAPFPPSSPSSPS